MRHAAITVRLLVVALATLGASGCEPGSHYRPSQPEPTRVGDYELEGASARLLTGSLDVRFRLRNVGLTLLSVDPERFRVVDARGHELPRRPAAPASSTEHVVYKLLRVMSLDLAGGFQVDPGRWPFFNRDLRTITIAVDVMGRAGVQVLQTSLDRS